MKHNGPAARIVGLGIRSRLRPLVLALALLGSACDDDSDGGASSGRDTRLEWPVDSGGFSTTDGGAPDRGAHASADGHTHDSADAHGPADAADAHHLPETDDSQGDNDASDNDASADAASD